MDDLAPNDALKALYARGKEFQKADTGKARWSLIPWDALLGIVHVLEYGARKYSPNNWAQGTDWNRYWDAMQRHLIAWQMGEPADPETGRSHLLHAGACLLFLAAYEIRGIGRDDRPSMPPETASEPALRAEPQAFLVPMTDEEKRWAAE